MESIPFLQTEMFSLVVLPLLIFLARTADVSLGTIRIISVYRGKKLLVFCLGFVEILIWVAAISTVLKHLDHIVNVIAYAAGFGMGNFVGIILEENLMLRQLLIRLFAVSDPTDFKKIFKSKGYSVTMMEATGQEGPVHILYAIINREDYQAIAEKIHAINPKTFYTVEDIRTAKEGVFPKSRSFKI